ncbi:MAG TPA: ATP-binding cassette domain-containing protein, partial [Methylomirabilota bacterium]|nr:ATP-binding cassette domain-containing protein [Methylomirabilota bacterium]
MTAAPQASATPAVDASGIVKAFPGVVANDHVDFELMPGEIHALLGENGAGKSTLMNILAGLYRPDEGEIRIDGEPVTFLSPRDAIAAGIGMVHQHFTLVPSQTVTENILLGLDKPRFLLDARRSEA